MRRAAVSGIGFLLFRWVQIAFLATTWTCYKVMNILYKDALLLKCLKRLAVRKNENSWWLIKKVRGREKVITLVNPELLLFSPLKWICSGWTSYGFFWLGILFSSAHFFSSSLNEYSLNMNKMSGDTEKKIRKFLVGYAHEKVWTVHRINSFKWIIYSHHVNWDLFKKKLNQSLISQYLPIVDINISLKWLFRWTLQNDFIFVGILGDEGMKKKSYQLKWRERERKTSKTRWHEKRK